MTDFYCDYLNGNNANAGTSWGTAKKDVRAASSTAVAGDRIKIAKTPYSDSRTLPGTWGATVNIAKMVGSTSVGCKSVMANAASGVTLTGYNSASVASTSSSSGYHVPPAPDATTVYAWKTTPPWQGTPLATNTKFAVCDLGSTIDLSGYQTISLWFCHVKQAASGFDDNTWVIKLCSDAAGDTAVETIPISNLSNYNSSSASYGQFVIYRKGSALSATVRSIALYSGTSGYTYMPDVFIACVNAHTAAAAVFPGDWVIEQDAKECFQVGRIESGETTPTLWFTVNGTPGVGNPTQGGCYHDWTGLTLLARSPTFLKSVDKYNSYATAVFPLNKGGSSGGAPYLEYVGGWNTGTDVVDGVTFLDAGYGSGEGIFYRDSSGSNGKRGQVLRNLYVAALYSLGGVWQSSSTDSWYDIYLTNCGVFYAGGSSGGGLGYKYASSTGQYTRLRNFSASECLFMAGTYIFSQAETMNGSFTNCKFYRCRIGDDTSWGATGTITYDNCKFRRCTALLNGYSTFTWLFTNGAVFDGAFGYIETKGYWELHSSNGTIALDNFTLYLNGFGTCDATIVEGKTLSGGSGGSPPAWTGVYNYGKEHPITVENYTNNRPATIPASINNAYLYNCSWTALANSSVGTWTVSNLKLENCTCSNTATGKSPIRFSLTLNTRLDLLNCTFTNFQIDNYDWGYVTMRGCTITNNVIAASVPNNMPPVYPGPRMVVANCTFNGETDSGYFAGYQGIYGGMGTVSAQAAKARGTEFEDFYRAYNTTPLNYIDGTTTPYSTIVLCAVAAFLPDTTTVHTPGGTSWLWKQWASYSYSRIPEDLIKFPLGRVAVIANHQLTASVWVRAEAQNSYLMALKAAPYQLSPTQPELRAAQTRTYPLEWVQVSLTYTPTVDGVLEFYITAFFWGDFGLDDVWFDDFTVSQA